MSFGPPKHKHSAKPSSIKSENSIKDDAVTAKITIIQNSIRQ